MTKPLDDIEDRVNFLIADLRAKRAATCLAGKWDAWVRTDELEYLDRPEFPAARKLEMVEALDRFNRVLGSYENFYSVLLPHLIQAERRWNRPARVLELASGAGGFALELSRIAAKKGRKLDLTASDIQPIYMENLETLARDQGIDLTCRQINAFELEKLKDQFDVIFIAQSMHHFTPGQLARMIAGSKKNASAFVGIDGIYGPLSLTVLPLLTAISLQRDFIHDAWLTARKLYSEEELMHIAGNAVPGCEVKVSRRRHHCVLEVLFPQQEVQPSL